MEGGVGRITSILFVSSVVKLIPLAFASMEHSEGMF